MGRAKPCLPPHTLAIARIFCVFKSISTDVNLRLFMSTENLPMTLIETQPLQESTEEHSIHLAKPGIHKHPCIQPRSLADPPSGQGFRSSALPSQPLPAGQTGVQGGEVGSH